MFNSFIVDFKSEKEALDGAANISNSQEGIWFIAKDNNQPGIVTVMEGQAFKDIVKEPNQSFTVIDCFHNGKSIVMKQ